MTEQEEKARTERGQGHNRRLGRTEESRRCSRQGRSKGATSIQLWQTEGRGNRKEVSRKVTPTRQDIIYLQEVSIEKKEKGKHNKGKMLALILS